MWQQKTCCDQPVIIHLRKAKKKNREWAWLTKHHWLIQQIQLSRFQRKNVKISVDSSFSWIKLWSHSAAGWELLSFLKSSLCLWRSEVRLLQAWRTDPWHEKPSLDLLLLVKKYTLFPLAKSCVFSKTGDPPSHDRVGGGVPPFFPIPALCCASCAAQGILGASDMPWSRHGRGCPSATLLPYVPNSVPDTPLFLTQKWPSLLLIANWRAFSYELVRLLPVGGVASAVACGGLSPRYLFKRYRVTL